MNRFLFLLLVPVFLFAGVNFEFDNNDYIEVSDACSPEVSYALSRQQKYLIVSVKVNSYEQSAEDADVQLGLSAAKKVVLSGQNADVVRKDGVATFNFGVPLESLINSGDDWKKLRMGLNAKWRNSVGGAYRQKERFLHTDAASPHSALSTDSSNWQILDIDGYESIVSDRKSSISFVVEQPMDGKMTVVIEDEKGKRVRNLVSGVAKVKGDYKIEWDGFDNFGKLVPVGKYNWRAISHPGIKPEYLFSFANGGEKSIKPFGPNHNIFEDVTSNSKYIFIAAPSTEGGNSLIAVDEDGKLVRAYNKIHGTGLAAVAVAADEDVLYVAYDGTGWGHKVDKKKQDWKTEVPFFLAKYDIQSAKTIDFPDRVRCATFASHGYGPGFTNKVYNESVSLAGMALCGGKLYVSTRHAQAVLVVDPKTGKEVGKLDVVSPGAIASYGDDLYVVSGENILVFREGKGLPKIVAKKIGECSGLAVDDEGRFYVSDSENNVVNVLSPRGRKVKTIGKSGGSYEGTYVAERLINPIGLEAVRGRLWVTENRRNPKRVTGWDIDSGKVVVTKYGNPPYGGPACSFDFKDHSKWLGLRSSWELDFDTQTATCKSVLQKAGGHIGGKMPWSIHYRFIHKDDRIFLIGMGKTTMICELMPDGSVRDLAMLSATHQFSYSFGWKPPQSYIDAFNKTFPDLIGKHMDRVAGVLWVDGNGDGLCQENEFNFSRKTLQFAGAGWGHEHYDLNLHVPVTRDDGKRGFVVLEPDGYLNSGAPNYPKLDEAVNNMITFKEEYPGGGSKSLQVSTAVDQFGRLILSTDPHMTGYSKNGELEWTYPNKWSNVHGSHNAPLPETGVMQGVLFFLGVAPFDNSADVFIVNGNHGRFFALTTDGMYLDEMFKDVRLGGSRDAYWVGGEAFGGFFGKSERNGEYYLQTGGDGFRIFKMHGLDECVRSSGSFDVIPEQLMAAERKLSRIKAAEAKSKETTIKTVSGQMHMDGRNTDWDKNETAQWSRNNMFPVKVKVAYDEANLYLYYYVVDSSPWKNGGKDWTSLFKTGDSIDLQLGLNPKASDHRNGPEPGDMRLLIAPFEDGNIAVLYRHRVPGTKKPFVFSSPWRSENVDEVKRLSNAKIAVQTSDRGYSVEAMIPLADLGLEVLPDKPVKGDFGVIYGDSAGTVNVLRSYWSNEATGLVNDVPGEIMLNPRLWGKVDFQ